MEIQHPVEVAESIYRIDTTYRGRLNALHLLKGDAKVILVDCGTVQVVDTVLEPSLCRIGLTISEITDIVITHGDLDHFGGLGRLLDLNPSATVWAHSADTPWIENVDRAVSERATVFFSELGEVADNWFRSFVQANIRSGPVTVNPGNQTPIDLGGWEVVILHTIGHTSGSISVWDKRSGSLICGDAVLGRGLKFLDGSPAFAPVYSHMPGYVDTLGAIGTLKPQQLLAAHDPPIRGDDVPAVLAESVGFVTRLDSDLDDIFAQAEEPLALKALVERVAEHLDCWPRPAWPALAYPIFAHIEQRMEHGTVEAFEGATGVRYATRS